MAPAYGQRRSRDERTYNMSKNASKNEAKVEVVFILDRSGSMRGLENDTIGGFNSMLEKQQKEGGRLGVRASRLARFHNDGEGIGRNYDTLNNVVRSMCCKEIIRDDCLDPIRDDYEKRNKE